MRALKERARDVASQRLKAMYLEKARKIQETDLAGLRQAYQAERVSEICRAARFDLSRVVPGIVWLEA